MGNASMLGPLDEGTQVEMICEANAGRPTPKVTWYNGTKELKAHYSSHEDGDGLGTGTAKLQFTLSRGDLGAKFECKVDSKALDEPIVSWMTADVNVKPTGMKLSGVKSHVVQGTNVLLTCDVFGARPAAEVKWFNNSAPIISDEKISLDSTPEHERDGTFTTKSTLIFQASRYENGNAFHCYSDNSVIREQKESSLHEVLLIEVYFPPVVTVSPANITTNETGDILLLCTYISNPMKLDGVVWSRSGKNLTLTDDKYEGGTTENPPLIVKNVSRDDMGDYTCSCKNSVGSQESEESVYLNVQYVPSVEVSMEPSTPVKEKDNTTVTLICSVSAGNPAVLTKVRWFLGGSLLKELPDCNYTSYNDEGEPEGSGGQFCGVDPSIISLENVSEGMAGNYTCQGMNIAGWGPESDPQELIVYYPPSPAKVRFTPSKVIKRASVTLDCSVNHPGRPENITYLWYRGSYQVPDVTTSNWTISPVLLETKSNFTCIASNEGGISDPATVFIDVSAPPAFIQNLPPYQGVLMSSKNISLTCRVECSPLCSITWFKDGHQLNVNNNPLYYVKTAVFPPDLRKNDFESIESTLVWNMTAWPGEMLDRIAVNSNYTCQSSPNGIGPGVNSTIEIAVDYPPENLTVSNRVVSVVENHKPEKVVCSGKGHPALTYVWRRDGSAEPLSKSHFLNLGAVPRSASGKYVCEATNRHGTETTNVYLNVQYSPGCTIETVEYDGGPALECTAHANPQEVTFTYKIKGENDTVEGFNLVHKGLKGYLKLDSSVDSFRTYQCFVNNSVGISSPCERDVTGVAPWWRQFTNENILIMIAIIVGIIIFVIIICIIIIIVCRRKRANNKYTNAVEMEEREKPDGQSPDTSGSKWPLKPGVLLHVNKMNNMHQFTTLGGKQYKTTSVPCHRIPYKSRGKVYAKLEKLREFLGMKDKDSLPFGVYRGSAGVVTFKKFKDCSSPTHTDAVTISRKRKKPGLPPNPSSTADKGGLGAAPPGGGSADPLTDPDKGFYENLPFHGMQNPPNKPISIISPMVQDASLNKSFLPQNYSGFNTMNTLDMKKIQRNQSFHGFQNQQIFHQLYNNPFSFSQNFTQWPQYYPTLQYSHPNLHQQILPSIFYNLPRNFSQTTGNKTVGAIRTNPQINPFNYNNRVQSYGNLQSQFYNNPFMITNPFNQPRVSGRNEKKIDIRRTASGINLSNNTNENISNTDKDSKRFNSLELKKQHKCYSPTFYSMRCKKHAKKRPVIYALPKRSNSCQNKPTESVNNHSNEQYQDLTDSIQIFEQNVDNNLSESTPKPAPRCSKHKCNETIYENVSGSIKTESDETLSSNNSSENCDPEVSVTEVLIHKQEKTEENKDKAKFIPKISEFTPKLKDICIPKSTPVLKITPTVKVSPNFIKPKTESPKGALFMQLQAKIKSPSQNTNNILNSSALVQKALSQTSLNHSTSSLNKIDPPHSPPKIAKNSDGSPQNYDISFTPPKSDDPKENQPPVPQMPIIDTENKWNSVNNTNKNAFYTLTTPHLKQLTGTNMHQQYSATIPHQKHMKLIPRSLFQDQQIAKSKSFSSKSKPKKHFQIPLQKCHSFKFQTAESYFQPIKNIHEENFMRNGYISDLGPNYPESSSRPHKRDKQKTNGPLVLRRPGEYQENRQFQENIQSSVQLQYPQPVVGRNNPIPKPNGIVYADLDMPKSSSNKSSNKKSSKDGHASLSKSQKAKAKTEYATLQFNDVGQEIDV